MLIATPLVTDSSFLAFEPWSALPGEIRTAKEAKRKVERGLAVLLYLKGNSGSVDLMKREKTEFTSELFLIKKNYLQHVHYSGLNPFNQQAESEREFSRSSSKAVCFSNAIYVL